MKHKKKKPKRKSIEPFLESTEPSEDKLNSVTRDNGEPAKKPKKRKRDSRAAELDETEDSTLPKKHKAILSKFERSSKRAEIFRTDAEEEHQNEKEGEEVAEELHGITGRTTYASSPVLIGS
jgi:ATP-dependent RNA helicase DDX51/DBP6